MKKSHKFLVYDDEGVSIGSLLTSLKTEFENTSIEISRCSALDILNNPHLFDHNTIGFWLPGIIGENCLYTDQLGHEGIRILKHQIETNGHSIIGTCAGAYCLAQKTQYDTEWGTHKSRMFGLNHFPGIAKGPISPLAKRPDTSIDELSDCSLALLTLEQENQDHQVIGVCYGNGPQLELSSGNHDVTIIARYTAIPDNPIAIAMRNVGQGLSIFSGVLPEITGQEGLGNSLLNRQLCFYEKGRKQLFQTLLNTTIQHYNETRSDDVPLLKMPNACALA